MKKFVTGVPILLCFLFCSHSMAQITDTRTAMFAAYPAKIIMNEAQLAAYFTKSAGGNSDELLTPSFEFSGKISSNIQKYPNLQTVVVQSTNFPGTLMQVSKIINPDNSISYSCHILNRKASDGYEMKPTEAGEYILIKVQALDLLQDCNY